MKLTDWIKQDVAALLVVVAPFVALPFLWNRMPELIPMHWNIDGKVDRYASTAMGLLFIPLLNVFLYVLFSMIGHIDPKQKVRIRQKPLPAIRFILLLFLLGIYVVQLAAALGMDTMGSTNLLLVVVIGLFIAIGNYLTSIQPNYFIGIRTPWTLEDDQIWRETHRLGGWLWVGVGCIMLLLWLIVDPAWFRTVFLIGVLVMAGVPFVYSYLLYRNSK